MMTMISIVTIAIKPNSYLSITDYCAKLYEHKDFKGESHEIKETNHLNFPKKWNNKVSSVKVSDGCTLDLFKYYKKSVLLDTVVKNGNLFKGYNDKVSSVTCTCQSKF